MKKFALVSHVLPPSWSGQSIVLGRLLKGIDPESYISISRMNFGDEKKGYHLRSLLDHFRLNSLIYHPIFSRFQWLKTILFRLELMNRSRQIIKIIRKENCGSIVACSGDLFDIPAAYFAGVKAKISVIPYYFDDYVYQWADPFSRKFAQKYENLLFKRNSKALVPNEFMKEEILKRQHVEATIIRNPANPESSVVALKEAPSQYEIKIVYTGAVYHVNMAAFRTLIEAMNSLKEISVSLHLYTAQPIDYLKNGGISGDKVHIHSHASSKETALAQQDADILFIPFSFDSSVPEVIKTSAPGKLADYLSSGNPILAFVPPDSFVAWFLKKHNCGLVVEENDSQLLINGITILATNEQLRKTVVQNAIEIVKTEFDTHKASISLISVISKSSANS